MLHKKKLKRILIKLSGEAFSSPDNKPKIRPIIHSIVSDIKKSIALGIQLSIVVGGGNILRGNRNGLNKYINRITADHMGMLATMINSLALSDMLNYMDIDNEVLSSKSLDGVLNCSTSKVSGQYLSQGKVVIFAGGTGNPLVTTDTAAVLRAVETNSCAVLKMTHVDGAYDKDPYNHKEAIMIKKMSFDEALKREIAVMDLGALVQARDFKKPICIFNLNKPGVLLRILQGEKEGSWIESQ